jgi:hypothetical protein
MKRKLTFLFFLFIAAASLKLQAQAVLGFDTGFPISFPNVVFQDDTASFKVRFRNYGNAAITDSIKVASGYKTSNGAVLYVQDDQVFPSNPVFLAAADTVSRRVITYYSANRFPLGIDVVVIWPYAASAITFDSLEYVPSVLPPLRVAEMLYDNGIKVFPNPFVDKLTIKAQQTIEQVSIYDMSGKLIFSKSREETIDLSELKNAAYVVELKYKSGTRRIIRVQKQGSSGSK